MPHARHAWLWLSRLAVQVLCLTWIGRVLQRLGTPDRRARGTRRRAGRLGVVRRVGMSTWSRVPRLGSGVGDEMGGEGSGF